MHQSGRGRPLASGWHGQPSPGKFFTLAASPQVMRGRSPAKPERIVACVRLGYFEGFKGSNTLLLDGDGDGLGELVQTLSALANGERQVVSVHSLPFVSAAQRVELHAHRSLQDVGARKTGDGFQWRRNSEGWGSVVEQILAVKD